MLLRYDLTIIDPASILSPGYDGASFDILRISAEGQEKESAVPFLPA
jgi:hypothetical protein